MTSGTVATGSAQEKVRCSARCDAVTPPPRSPSAKRSHPTTVRRHISDLVDKLGLEDRSALTTRT
jgi:hypothetical protein